jgi:hypothetical protein
MTRRAAFKRTDVTRATRAVLAAGLSVARIEIQDGKITVVPGNSDQPGQSKAPNEWDEVLTDGTAAEIR